MKHRQRPLSPNRPSVTQARPLVRALYASPGGGVGCCMHVQLDDGNVEDRFFREDMRAYVIACGNPEHLELFDMLAQMSVTQRRKLSE